MAVICPYKNHPCWNCEYCGYDDDRQRKACYYGKPEDDIKKARENLVRHNSEVREYHMEEAAIGDL